MVIIPFIFFLILTIYWWREHGADICTYMSSLYAFTTFLAVLIIFLGISEGTDGDDSGGMLWGANEPVLGILPTVSFCVLIGLCIYPFSLIKAKDIKTIGTRAPNSLLVLSGLFISTGIIQLYCVADSTLSILSGDLEFVRQLAYSGDSTPSELKSMSLPFPLGYLTYLNFATILAMPIFFYNLCFENRPWWWNALLLFSSTTSIMAGIQRADRTEPIFFALMFVFCIIFFRHFFNRKAKLVVGGIIGAFSLLLMVYISAVSLARFEDRKNGNAIMSITQYAGQGFLNYCFFCENGTFATYSTERELPLYNHFVTKIESDADRRGERSAKEGFFISVFGTFIGDILLDIGPMLMPLWVLAFALFTMVVIRHKGREELDLSEVLLLFFLASIPLFGVFYYRYHRWTIAFVYITILIYWIASNFKFVYEDTDDNSDV